MHTVAVLDECAMRGMPCKNGAYCSLLGGGQIRCECPDDYGGHDCSIGVFKNYSIAIMISCSNTLGNILCGGNIQPHMHVKVYFCMDERILNFAKH